MGRKRFLALVMALSMLFTLMAPALTFATGTGSEEETPGAGTSEVTEEANEQGSDTDPDEGDGAGNDAGDTNTGADNTGDTGDTDTGDVDTGDVDTGADNTGDTGTGDAGADNTGDTGTGDSDTGDVDTGDVDTGDTDTGDTDTGADNTGDTGDTGTGDSDTGDTDTGDVDTGDVDTGADENTDAAQDSGKTLPPATVPGDGDGEGDGEGDADKGGDQLLSDGDLGEEEVEKTRGTTEPTTITVAIISYVNRNRGTTGWTVHYWDDASNGGDAPCSLTNPQTVVKHSLDGYWENAPKDFLVYTATIPADVTGYEIHKDGNKINTDFNTDLSNKGVYVFEYGDVYHTQFVESIGYTLGAITVYYKTTWGQPRVHYWFTDGGSVDFGGTTWPGVYMTPVQNQENKFKATIPANVGGLLFNNGSGDQTVDIRNGIENGAFWRPNGNSDTSGHLYVESANITVTFDLNEGNIGDDTNKVEVTIQEGDCVSAPNPAPTKAGCRFIGWSLSNNNELFNFEQGLYTNAILYAQYKQLYTVTAGAGEVENGTVTADKTQAVEGETVTLTVTPAEGFALKSMTVTGDDGVVPVENNSFIMPASDVTVTATFSPAKIGETLYATLSDAIAAVPENAGDATTIELIASTKDGLQIPAGKKVILDLNGNTLTVDAGSDSYDYILGELTIKDTDTGTAGKVIVDDYGIAPKGSGKLTIENGAFETKDADDYYMFYLMGGELVVNGGTFTGSYNIVNCYADGNLALGGKATIKGGTFTVSDSDGVVVMGYANSDIAISGGTFDGAYAVWTGKGTVNDGVTYTAAKMTITGGTFNGAAGADGDATLAIYDGLFDGGLEAEDGGTIVISGGYFTEEPALEYCAEGLCPIAVLKDFARSEAAEKTNTSTLSVPRLRRSAKRCMQRLKKQ